MCICMTPQFPDISNEEVLVWQWQPSCQRHSPPRCWYLSALTQITSWRPSPRHSSTTPSWPSTDNRWQPVPLHDTIQPLVKPVGQPLGCLLTRCSRLFNQLFSQFDNRLYSVNRPRLHDTAGCQTGWTTGWMFVYTMQPVVQPVVQPVWQLVVSCKRGFRLCDVVSQ